MFLPIDMHGVYNWHVLLSTLYYVQARAAPPPHQALLRLPRRVLDVTRFRALGGPASGRAVAGRGIGPVEHRDHALQLDRGVLVLAELGVCGPQDLGDIGGSLSPTWPATPEIKTRPPNTIPLVAFRSRPCRWAVARLAQEHARTGNPRRKRWRQAGKRRMSRSMGALCAGEAACKCRFKSASSDTSGDHT